MTEDYSEAKKVLETFVNFVASGKPGSRQVWDIMSAMRGPDSENFQAKLSSTAQIRHALFSAFGRTFTYGDATNYDRALFGMYFDKSPHFNNHVQLGIDALKELKLVQNGKEIEVLDLPDNFILQMSDLYRATTSGGADHQDSIFTSDGKTLAYFRGKMKEMGYSNVYMIKLSPRNPIKTKKIMV